MRTDHDSSKETGIHGLVFAVFTFTLAWPLLAIPAHQTLLVFFGYLMAIWCLMTVSLWLLARHDFDKRTDSSSDSRKTGEITRV